MNQPSAPRFPDVKSFRGDFGLTMRIRRDSFEEMEAIATRLLELFPDDTIHIDRRVARVKLKPAHVAENDFTADTIDPSRVPSPAHQTPSAHPPRALRPDREGAAPALPVTREVTSNG